MAMDEPSENEEQLRFVANAVPALLAYVDTGARYVWCNESYRRWFGYAPEELRGRHVQRGAGRDGVGAASPVRRARAGGRGGHVRAAGSTTRAARHATFAPPTSPTGIRAGQVRGFVVLVQRHHARSAPPSGRCAGASTCSSDRSRSAHVGSWEVTLVGQRRRARGHGALVGRDLPDVRLRARRLRRSPHASFFELHPPGRSRARCAPAWRPRIQRGEPFENEFRIVRADGDGAAHAHLDRLRVRRRGQARSA